MQAAPRGSGSLARWLGATGVGLAVATYYWLFFLPPRLLGSVDPDRYYHLALSRMTAADGLLRRLPQVEDLGWGSYFPDKEFLFHVLTGTAWKLGEAPAVLALVPLIGIAVVLLLYSQLSRQLRPVPAALIAIVGSIGTAGFMFRLTLLRPHLLAILVFCLLVLAILRERPRLAALAAAAFALSYHAFYLVGIVIAAAWLLRRQPGFSRTTWAWCLAGLGLGVLLNPYFPSTVMMSVLHMRLALGPEAGALVQPGQELFKPTLVQLLEAYGFVPVTLLVAAIAVWLRKPAASPERSGLLFLWLLAAGFTLLSTRSLRAMEYGVPCGVLLMGYTARLLDRRYAVPLLLSALLLCQAHLDYRFYRESWRPMQTALPVYEELLRQIPMGRGSKVFNCEWEAGPFILLRRPDLRFVDLLEPSFLLHASPERYQARQGLLAGAFSDPRSILRGAFDADYVICAAPALIRQMEARPQDFAAEPGTQGKRVRLFVVRPD